MEIHTRVVYLHTNNIFFEHQIISLRVLLLPFEEVFHCVVECQISTETEKGLWYHERETKSRKNKRMQKVDFLSGAIFFPWKTNETRLK